MMSVIRRVAYPVDAYFASPPSRAYPQMTGSRRRCSLCSLKSRTLNLAVVHGRMEGRIRLFQRAGRDNLHALYDCENRPPHKNLPPYVRLKVQAAGKREDV